MPTRRLALLFVFVLVELFGFSLIVPILPFFAGSLGASPVMVGLLVASNAFAQLIGAPIIGHLSDRWGRRPMLLFSIGSTTISFVLLGLANTLFLMFISRFLDGLFGGSIALAQAYVTDITDEQNRARGLGILGAAFGLGFIAGPALGGRLSVLGFGVPAFLAAGLALLNLISMALWLPESLDPERRAQLADEQGEITPRTLLLVPWQVFRSAWGAMQRPRVGPLLQIRLFYSLAFTLFQSLFPLYARLHLGLNVRQTGDILTYVGALVALVQGVGIGWMTARFAEMRLVFYGMILMVGTLLGWAFAPSVPFLLVVLAFMALSSGSINTLLSSLLTKAVYVQEVGGMLGFSSSLQSLSRVVSPAVGSVLLQVLGTWAPGTLAAAVMAWVVAFTWRTLLRGNVPPENGGGN
ncbi:MAG: major facilitator superfamily domain-containing protein 9 [Chloroflexi bacterium]|nr:major facilitator superfamily domain-containing protein 9 [Chloroflexota bacterium]